MSVVPPFSGHSRNVGYDLDEAATMNVLRHETENEYPCFKEKGGSASGTA